MSRAKAPSLLGIINAMSGVPTDRNVHLRARQADIYEKALRKLSRGLEGSIRKLSRGLEGSIPITAWAKKIIEDALKGAERLK